MVGITHCTIELLILLRIHVINSPFESDVPGGVGLRVNLDNPIPVFQLLDTGSLTLGLI